MMTTRRLLLGGAGVGALALASAVAYLATRGDGDAAAASGTSGHVHGASGGTTQQGTPVSLTSEQAERIGVTYASVAIMPLGREIRTVGQITFDERRVHAVALKVDGWVEALHVNFTGQLVRAGEPLLGIYSPMLVQAQEELLLAARLVRDVSGGGAEARTGGQELLAAARRRLAYLDVPASEIADIERTGRVRRVVTLRAPASGHVLEKNVLQGQRVMAGEPLFRLGDLATVWVEGDVFEQDLGVVRVGQQAHADFQALPGEHYMGRITYIQPTLDAETRTARVRVELPNLALRLKPGMFATLRIEGGTGASALTVPRSAVLVTGERSIVFVRGDDGRLVPRDVRVGRATSDRVEILAGLAAGEVVVSSATFLIDAESNLGTALDDGAQPLVPGGPAMRTPSSGEAAAPAPPRAPAAAPPAADPHAGHGAPAPGGRPTP